MGPQKNTLAAEKMVFLAAGGNPGSIHLWGILLGLSLAVCRTTSLHPETPFHMEGQSPIDKCRQCLQVILEGQGEMGISAYPAPEDCHDNGKSRYCTLNGTQFKICELDGKTVCFNLKARSKDRQSETYKHKMYKRDVG